MPSLVRLSDSVPSVSSASPSKEKQSQEHEEERRVKQEAMVCFSFDVPLCPSVRDSTHFPYLRGPLWNESLAKATFELQGSTWAASHLMLSERTDSAIESGPLISSISQTDVSLAFCRLWHAWRCCSYKRNIFQACRRCISICLKIHRDVILWCLAILVLHVGQGKPSMLVRPNQPSLLKRRRRGCRCKQKVTRSLEISRKVNQRSNWKKKMLLLWQVRVRLRRRMWTLKVLWNEAGFRAKKRCTAASLARFER